MVLRVLNNEVYIGNSVHYRNRKPNLKNKTKRQPKDSYLIILNTHEPSIDDETWGAAKRKLTTMWMARKSTRTYLSALQNAQTVENP